MLHRPVVVVLLVVMLMVVVVLCDVVTVVAYFAAVAEALCHPDICRIDLVVGLMDLVVVEEYWLMRS